MTGTNGQHADEADRHRDGTLPRDPREGTKPVAVRVPQILSEAEVLAASRVRAISLKVDESCTTGHYRLDWITGGIKPGYTWLFGADTSFGKSSWLVSVYDENEKRVLICSAEDTEEMYGDRLMVRRARVNALRLRDKRLTDQEKQRIIDVENAARPRPAFLNAKGWHIEDLAGREYLRGDNKKPGPLVQAIREHKIDVCAFDYLQEFSSARNHQDERVKFREIAKVMRYVTKNERIAGIIFSQLTLDAETKVPTRKNIRECKDVANASEVILIGFEPEKDVTRKNGSVMITAGTKTVLVDKVKNGPKGAKVPLSWSKEHACFNRVVEPEGHNYELWNKEQDSPEAHAEQRYP
jgi:replicative DNA helicase